VALPRPVQNGAATEARTNLDFIEAQTLSGIAFVSGAVLIANGRL
jgi:hypothetical protein